MSTVNININNIDVTVPEGSTILEGAKKLGIHIPTLCHLDLCNLNVLNQTASCRVCMVEVEGYNVLMPACATKVRESMKIVTNSKEAVNARRTVVELLLSDHPSDCLVCEKNTHCDLQTLAADLGIRGKLKYNGKQSSYPISSNSKSIYRNPAKCIMCRRCETVCNEVQTCNVLSAVNRGFDTVIQTAFSLDLNKTTCTFCGQCIAVCPTAALTEINNISDVWSVLNDKSKHVVVQTAPAVRFALGEEFGMEIGTEVTGKMVTLLNQLGFDKVFDTDFAADLTIMEEAHELISRVKENKNLPLLTSCCPSWVNFVEQNFPNLLYMPSTCKSPHQMFGTIAKTYYAEKQGIDPKDIVVVSIMPCVSKKYESSREELSYNELKDVDYVITTRELASMCREAGLPFTELKDSEFDNPLGESSGAGVIFGSTGGVMEAALRTSYEWLTNETLESVDFEVLRGFNGIREATVKANDLEMKVAIAHGLGNARKLLTMIENKEASYHAIEIMACPGGCIGGGGQPYHVGNPDVLEKRREAVYSADKNKTRRKSHENPSIVKLYEDYLGDVGGHKAHELLHTTFKEKKGFK